MAYLLRLVLPDRPGMLGAVATALGRAGADIVSLDVVERGGGFAVDDVLIELPAGALADRLITAGQSVAGVTVESLRPYAGASDLHRDLELVEELALAARDPVSLLLAHAPGVFRAGWGVLVQAGRGAVQGSPGAPVGPLDTSWLPLTAARAVAPDEPWVPEHWRLLGTTLVAAPLDHPERAVVVGRPGGPRFRASEVLRLAHLAGIAVAAASALRPPQ